MKEARAFAPAHITGIFQIFDQPEDNLRKGSRGAGVSLKSGVITIVKAKKSRNASLEVKINGSTSNSAEVTKKVVKDFFYKFREKMANCKVVIDHQVNLPIGAGFGTSGAAALSLALALNEAFELSMSKVESAQIAHAAEVKCKTGLGTVTAETFGGVEIRIKPGAPGIGKVKHIPVKKDMMVACLSFGPLSTRKFLTDETIRKRINKFGGKLVDRLAEEPNLTNFMNFSRQFAEQVGVITEKLRYTLKMADKAGFTCSVPMFGESVFTIIEKEDIQEICKIFNKQNLGGKIVISEIDFEGARLLS
jgi:pantoate kinase